jgi:hypothetical protein
MNPSDLTNEKMGIHQSGTTLACVLPCLGVEIFIIY